MGRKSTVLLTMLGCVGLASAMTASTAFAVADVNAGNTSVAAELVPATGTFNVPNVNTAYEPGGALAISSQISISLTNGSWANGSAVSICDHSRGAFPASHLGTSATLTANSPSVTITLNDQVGQSSVLTFQDEGCVTENIPLSNVLVNPGAQAGDNVVITVDNALAPGDPDVFATDTLAFIKNQFTAEIQKVVSKLDFSTNQNSFIAEGGPQPPQTDTNNSDAGLIISSDETIANKVDVLTPGSCGGTLNTSTDLIVVLTGDLNGLDLLDYDSGPSAAIGAAEIAAQEVTLTLPGGSLNICVPGDVPTAEDLSLNNDSDVNTSILTGVRVSKVSLSGTGDWGAGNVRTLADADSHDFTLDATTFFIPLIVFDTPNGTNTFTKVSSSSLLTGANGVTGVILTDDGTYANCSFGTITPGTPLEITGADWDSCITTAGKSANLAVGESAKVIVNAPEANVQGLTNLTFLGNLQRVPMQILDPARGE